MKRVEKKKKSIHERVVPVVDRRTSSRGMYIRLDGRKLGGESVSVGLRNRKLRCPVDDEMKTYPSSDYQRMFET